MDKYEKITKATGQDLTKKTVAIAGLGSVGTSLAESFARAGLNLRIVDMGRVKIEDLATNSLTRSDELDKFKAKEAKKHLEQINPDIKVKSFHEQLNEDNIYLLEADVVIDCTQTWEMSRMINKFCKKKKIPLVYTRVAGSEGLIYSKKGGYVEKKMEPHIEKLGKVKEKGLLPSTIHMASSIALSKSCQYLLGAKASDKLYYFDTAKMSKRESGL